MSGASSAKTSVSKVAPFQRKTHAASPLLTPTGARNQRSSTSQYAKKRKISELELTKNGGVEHTPVTVCPLSE